MSRVELAVKVDRLRDHDVDIRRLSARVHLLVGGVFFTEDHAPNPSALTRI